MCNQKDATERNMKTTEELYINLRKVIEKETNQSNTEFLENIISFIYKKKLGKVYTKELIGEVKKKINKKGRRKRYDTRND